MPRIKVDIDDLGRVHALPHDLPTVTVVFVDEKAKYCEIRYSWETRDYVLYFDHVEVARIPEEHLRDAVERGMTYVPATWRLT